jgi:antitoxin component of RelBE/YafQ-DinJ toxin-antitoxin module
MMEQAPQEMPQQTQGGGIDPRLQEFIQSLPPEIKQEVAMKAQQVAQQNNMPIEQAVEMVVMDMQQAQQGQDVPVQQPNPQALTQNAVQDEYGREQAINKELQMQQALKEQAMLQEKMNQRNRPSGRANELSQQFANERLQNQQQQMMG